MPQAIDAASSIALQLEARRETSDLIYQTLATMLDVMLSLEGRRAEAREWNRKLIEVIERSEGSTTISMSTARHNQAGHLQDAGEMRAALEAERAVVDNLLTQQGEDVLAAAYAHRLGLLQVLVEESDAGIEWLDRAVTTAEEQSEHRAHIGALLGRARAHLELGHLDRVFADIEHAEKLAQASPDENAAPLRWARFMRADLASRRGDHASALRQINAVLDEIGYPKVRVANQLAPMLTLKSRAELALRQDSAALDTAIGAVEIAQANAPCPERNAHVGAALMALPEAQRATGSVEASRASAARAASALAAGLGEGHSATVAAAAFR